MTHQRRSFSEHEFKISGPAIWVGLIVVALLLGLTIALPTVGEKVHPNWYQPAVIHAD